MRLQPIIYTKDMAKAVAWYGQVLGMSPSYQSEIWTTFDVDGAHLAIHRVDGDLPTESRVAVSFVADTRLETLLERWADMDEIELLRGIEDETFGRSLLLTDPDGSVIQVNEHD